MLCEKWKREHECYLLGTRNTIYYTILTTIYNEFYVSFPLIINVPIIIILIYCYQRCNLCTNNINQLWNFDINLFQ